MLLFSCNYTLSIYNCCHKVSNVPSSAFVTSFSSETEIKSLSRLSPGHNSWRSGLVKRINLMRKTCSIQIECYTLLPKVCRKFATNFSSNCKPLFQVIFGQGFLSSEHQPISGQPFATVSSLMDGGMPAFTITLFTQNFPISSCNSLVCRKIFLFF